MPCRRSTLIAVVGGDTENVEDLIEIVARNESGERRFINTTSHRNASLKEVLTFVCLYVTGPGAQIEWVQF